MLLKYIYALKCTMRRTLKNHLYFMNTYIHTRTHTYTYIRDLY